jgi:hypothetical protein
MKYEEDLVYRTRKKDLRNSVIFRSMAQELLGPLQDIFFWSKKRLP